MWVGHTQRKFDEIHFKRWSLIRCQILARSLQRDEERRICAAARRDVCALPRGRVHCDGRALHVRPARDGPPAHIAGRVGPRPHGLYDLCRGALALVGLAQEGARRVQGRRQATPPSTPRGEEAAGQAEAARATSGGTGRAASGGTGRAAPGPTLQAAE